MKELSTILKSLEDIKASDFKISLKVGDQWFTISPESELQEITSTQELPVIKSASEEEQIAIDVVYEPNKLDAHNQWMSEETIRKACANFQKNLESGNLKSNLYHAFNTEKIRTLRSWVLDEDTLYNDKLIRKGTWMVETKFLDPEYWQMKKDGILTGVSIGAKGTIKPPTILPEEDNELDG